MKLPKGEIAVLRTKEGRFRITIPKGLALALDLRGGERGRFKLVEYTEEKVVLTLEIQRRRG